jgi:predicted nuclease of restriction endonuclease-like (RecB) superfamily
MSLSIDSEYKDWLRELKANIKSTQIKASLAVNTHIIDFYWNLGSQIVERQQNAKWGSGFIPQLSKDLQAEFPDMTGFSRTNIFAIRKFYLFYNQDFTFVPQVGGQIARSEFLNLCIHVPWKHNVTIIEKVKDLDEAKFYIQQTIENNWSRAVLEMQIETNLYARQGKGITNFKNRLVVC